MDFDFEEFSRKSAPIGAKPYVTIQRRGAISLNRTAFDSLGKPQAVKLLYDRKQRVIGLRPTELGIEGAYPVRTQASSNWLIAGTAFVAHWGIDTSVAKRYEAEMTGDVLVIDLKSQGVEVTGPRAKQPVAV